MLNSERLREHGAQLSTSNSAAVDARQLAAGRGRNYKRRGENKHACTRCHFFPNKTAVKKNCATRIGGSAHEHRCHGRRDWLGEELFRARGKKYKTVNAKSTTMPSKAATNLVKP